MAIANISNSIIADNTNDDDFVHNFPTQIISQLAGINFTKDVVGENTSGGNNLMGNGEGITGFTNDDIIGSDRLLGDLTDNGGATETHALLEGSPTIDVGDNSKIASDTADLNGDEDTGEDIPFEQRGEGFDRIVGDTVDIGAVKFVAASSTNNIFINVILADPAAGNDGDANGDGTRDNSDEFVELVNNSDSAIDISGWTLSDASGVKHTFPAETIVPAKGVIVVFGGGTPTGNFGGAIVQTASSRSLSLNNDGDTITLNNSTSDIATHIYGSEGGKDQSLTRNPDITGTYVQHSTATNSGGTLFSPGTKIGETTQPHTATPGVTISQSDNTTNVTENGATDSYTVVLDSQPTAEVIITVANNGQTTTDLTILTFTTDNWDTVQTVTVTATDDSEVEAEHTDTITHTVRSNDIGYENFVVSPITVNITDNEVEENSSTPIQGTGGKDKLLGTANNDQINGNEGKDYLNGKDGDDVLDGGGDKDRVYGGNGNDNLSGGTRTDYLNGGKDNDIVDGGEGRDRVYGGDGNDNLSGGAGNDYLKGDDGNDTLTGGSGNDRISGGDGLDSITGVDFTTFGAGEIDRLRGNADADIFVLGNENRAFYNDDNNLNKGKSDYALIEDFNLGEGDTIQLYGSGEDYFVEVSRGITSIYMNDDGVGELIGKIKGVSLQDMSQGFTFTVDIR